MPEIPVDPETAAHVEKVRTDKALGRIEVRFDAEKQATYLNLRRSGKGHYKAARTIGVPQAAISRFMDLNPPYADEVKAAHYEFMEKFEERLYEKADDGEFGPLKEVLSKGYPEKWGDATQVNVNVSGKVELEAGPAMQRIQAITARLIERAESQKELNSGEIIDAEVIE